MRDKRGYPLVDEQGFLKIESVNSLSFAQLSNWIKMVLFRKDLGTGGDRTISPYVFLKRVYHQLDPYVREAFHDAVLQHLADFASKKKAEWQAEVADQLLLLVGAVFRDSPRSNAPIDFLISITEQERFFQIEAQKNLHKRALQSLISIKYKANTEFWITQFKKGGDEYASIALSGLSLNSISITFEWIIDNASNNAVVNALFRRLPLLVKEYDCENISSHLRKLGPFLSDNHQNALYKNALRLGINLLSVFENFSIPEMNGLIQELQIEMSIPQKSMGDGVRILEQKLGKYSRPGIQSPDLKVIDGIVNIVGKNRLSLSPHYRNKLMENIEYLERHSPHIGYLLGMGKCILEQSGKDPKIFLEKKMVELR